MTKKIASPKLASEPDEPAVRCEVMALADLIRDVPNVRIHPPKNQRAIASSLAQFGPARSIVIDGKGVVRAGNGTVEQAVEAGITDVLVVDPKPGQLVAVRRDDWSATEATAYAIADNRAAELAEWDFEAMGNMMRSLREDGINLNLLGWEDHELEPILAANWKPPDVKDGDDGSGKGARTRKQNEGDEEGIVFTDEQWRTIEVAVARVRSEMADDTLSEGWCVARICQEYIDANRPS